MPKNIDSELSPWHAVNVPVIQSKLKLGHCTWKRPPSQSLYLYSLKLQRRQKKVRLTWFCPQVLFCPDTLQVCRPMLEPTSGLWLRLIAFLVMFTAVFTAFLLPISKFPHSYTFLCFLTKGVPLRNKWLFLFMSQFGFSAAGINHSFLFFLGWRDKYQWGETTCWQIHVRLHYCTNTAKEPLPFTNSPVPKTAHGQRKHTSAP